MQVPSGREDHPEHGCWWKRSLTRNCWITQQLTWRQSPSQKPLITKARKSVAGFKIRQGYPIGCKVTLRGERMWEFFERLITIAVPRIRDFRGLSAKSFDGRGNYSMGVREQIIFPEIDYDKVDRVRGLDITITTTAKSDEEGRALLAAFDFPFRK